MQLEDPKSQEQEKENNELPMLDLDDIEEVDPLNDGEFDNVELKLNKGKQSKVRRSIEDILEERALRRQLSDVFDEDILLD